MIKAKIYFFIILLISMSCATNPFTGKKTIALVPSSQILPMAFAEYDKFISKNKVIVDTDDSKLIKLVGKRISSAAKRWLDANNYHGYLKDYEWEFTLIDDEAINAWCMPGGKIVFYTGILPVAENETGIAAIMGHEVAHALANHGQQRMSAGLLQQAGLLLGSSVIKNDKDRAVFNSAYGLTSEYGAMLPFSRSNENEADKIGIYIMAIAGYDPDEASRLWERMDKNKDTKNSPAEFLSTHPSNDNRIKNLKILSPDAKIEAKKFGVLSFRKI